MNYLLDIKEESWKGTPNACCQLALRMWDTVMVNSEDIGDSITAR